MRSFHLSPQGRRWHVAALRIEMWERKEKEWKAKIQY